MDYLPFWRNQESRRQTLEGLHWHQRLLANDQHRIINTQLGYKRANFIYRCLLKRDADNLRTAQMQVCKRYQFRDLTNTGPAPGSPEIHDHPLVLLLTEILYVSLKVLKRILERLGR